MATIVGRSNRRWCHGIISKCRVKRRQWSCRKSRHSGEANQYPAPRAEFRGIHVSLPSTTLSVAYTYSPGERRVWDEHFRKVKKLVSAVQAVRPSYLITICGSIARPDRNLGQLIVCVTRRRKCPHFVLRFPTTITWMVPVFSQLA